MDNVKNVPEIRFEGFDGEWEEIKFQNVGDFYSGGTPLSSNANYYNGDISFIRSGEIDKNKTELFLTREGLINSAARLVKKGDVLLALYGATSGEISISKIEGAINQAILAIIPDENFSNYFIKNYFVIKKEEINSKYLQGGQKNLSGKIIKSIACIFPSSNEQTQIGNFFKNLDEKLELEKEKHEKLINFKKAMLDDMFPKEGAKVPKVRFEGFYDGWNYTILKNILSSEKKGKAQLSILKPGKNLYLDADALNGNSEFFCDAVPDVAKTDVLILWDGSKAGTVYSNFEGVLGSTLKSLTFNDSINSYYVYSFLDSKKDTIFNYYRTPNIPHVVRNFTSSFEIPIPSPEEQALIGSFFKNLDEKIELSEKRIGKIENFKKAMLDKMFV